MQGYPEQSTEQTNLNWLIRTVEELKIKVDQLMTDAIYAAIDRYFNNVMVDAIYDADTETIILSREIALGDGLHIYNADDNSLSIEEG